jgi:hypothetical protein
MSARSMLLRLAAVSRSAATPPSVVRLTDCAMVTSLPLR